MPLGWTWACEADCEDGDNWTPRLDGGTGGGLGFVVAVEPAPSLRFKILAKVFSTGLQQAGRGDCPPLTFGRKNGTALSSETWRWNGTAYHCPERVD